MKCPNCQKEIDHLIHRESIIDYYQFSVEDNRANYEWEESKPNGILNDYLCPECGLVLFETSKGAETFLKGEKP